MFGGLVVFKRDTKTARRALGLAAAAGFAALSMASQALAAQEIHITNVQMDTKFQATLSNFNGAVYSNGVQFTATFMGNGPLGLNGAAVPDLFGFCIDIFHEINLGAQSLFYMDNQGDPNPLTIDYHTANGTVLTNAQKTAMTNLIDTGFILHQHETVANYAETEMRIAAIQAAIWQVEVPAVTVNVISANLTTGVGSEFATYQSYFNAYKTGAYVPLGDANDRVFTITSLNGNQNFAIGWPIPGVPEPSTWAMMLLGFGGLGAMLRRRRAVALAA